MQPRRAAAPLLLASLASLLLLAAAQNPVLAPVQSSETGEAVKGGCGRRGR